MTAGEEEQQRRIAKGHKETLGNYGHVCNLIMVVVSQAYTCVKSCQIVHLKYRQFIVFNFTSINLGRKGAACHYLINVSENQNEASMHPY